MAFMRENIRKSFLMQNHLAQMLEIWYIGLPSGPLPSLLKWKSQGPKWVCPMSLVFEP